MRISPALLLALVTMPAAFSQAGPHFNVSAAYVPPASKGADGAVAVTFVALDPDVRVNEEPSPRLKLDSTQTVLVDKQKPAPSKAEAFDPEKAKYLDLSAPVLFAVAVSPDAPKGAQTAKATVTYFYCSKREGWCRKGTTPVDVALNVP
jgi:hypothetical protein